MSRRWWESSDLRLRTPRTHDPPPCLWAWRPGAARRWTSSQERPRRSAAELCLRASRTSGRRRVRSRDGRASRARSRPPRSLYESCPEAVLVRSWRARHPPAGPDPSLLGEPAWGGWVCCRAVGICRSRDQMCRAVGICRAGLTKERDQRDQRARRSRQWLHLPALLSARRRMVCCAAPTAMRRRRSARCCGA